MARTQSLDYDKRRETIMQTAADLYAAKGFLGASISELAEATKTSKSLIYHYYDGKEDILFDVMNAHVEILLAAAQEVEAANYPPEVKIRQLAHSLLILYNGAQNQQKILLNELPNLPADKRQIIVDTQRQILDVVDRLVQQLRPNLKQRRPVVMLLFGMLNWTHIWYDASGPMPPAALADLATDMFLGGLSK